MTLENFALLVNVVESDCAVKADSEREIAVVAASPGGVKAVDRAVAKKIKAGVTATSTRMSAVNAWRCSEPEELAAQPLNQLDSALRAACLVGALPVVEKILADGTVRARLRGMMHPVLSAASNSHIKVVGALLGARADVNLAKTSGATPVFMAGSFPHFMFSPLVFARSTSALAELASRLYLSRAGVLEQRQCNPTKYSLRQKPRNHKHSTSCSSSFRRG
jgi:hypothetical protein